MVQTPRNRGGVSRCQTIGFAREAARDRLACRRNRGPPGVHATVLLSRNALMKSRGRGKTSVLVCPELTSTSVWR